MQEKQLKDFFKKEIPTKVEPSKKEAKQKKEKKPKPQKEKYQGTFFHKIFSKIRDGYSFERNVNLLDETNVLYKRNIVIKNILTIANFLFLVFTYIGSKRTNLIIALVFTIVMFAMSITIGKLIRSEPDNLTKQKNAMYFTSLYAFLMAVAVYIKVVIGVNLEDNTNAIASFSITQAAYMLTFSSMIIIMLYQDVDLLKIMFKVQFIVYFILHITILYPLYKYAVNLKDLWAYLIADNSKVLMDIILRMLVILLMMLVIYVVVSISKYVGNKRVEELSKRKAMESEFKVVVQEVFDAIKIYQNQEKDISLQVHANKISAVAKLLATLLGFEYDRIKEISDYASVHVDKMEELNLDDDLNEIDKFSIIRYKTVLGSMILKRLQLSKKAEDIVRGIFENTIDDDFIYSVNQIQNERESQVVLIAEIYDILRSDKIYKKKLMHQRALDIIASQGNRFFNKEIVDRFIKYNEEIKDSYDDAL